MVAKDILYFMLDELLHIAQDQSEDPAIKEAADILHKEIFEEQNFNLVPAIR